jgi:hypothetical protein
VHPIDAVNEKEGKVAEGLEGRYVGLKKRSCYDSGKRKKAERRERREREWVGMGMGSRA